MSDNILKLINLLSKENITISSVESLTGGAFVASLVKIPGASKVVRGGLVVYQPEIKISLLGISASDIQKYGVVSAEIAKKMLLSGYAIMKSDIVVSFTGNAGPGKEIGSANVGDVYIGIKRNEEVKIFFFSFNGSRNDIINKVIDTTVDIINKTLHKEN